MRGRKVALTLTSPGERIRDAEGRWSAVGVPVGLTGVVAAAAGAVNRRDDQREQPGRAAVEEGVVLLPRGTPVNSATVIDLEGVGVLADGRYRIRAITRTVKHVRLAVVQVVP